MSSGSCSILSGFFSAFKHAFWQYAFALVFVPVLPTVVSVGDFGYEISSDCQP